MCNDDSGMAPAVYHLQHVEPHLAPLAEKPVAGVAHVARWYPLLLWGGLLLIWFLFNVR